MSTFDPTLDTSILSPPELAPYDAPPPTPERSYPTHPLHVEDSEEWGPFCAPAPSSERVTE